MARIDVDRGWGNLPPWLKTWSCPSCKSNAPIENWEIKIVQAGPNDLQGRKCPNCEWIASQTGETELMLQEDKQAVKIIAERGMTEKQKAGKIVDKTKVEDRG